MEKIGTCKIGGIKNSIYGYNVKLGWVLIKKTKYNRFKNSGYNTESVKWVTNGISDIKLI